MQQFRSILGLFGAYDSPLATGQGRRALRAIYTLFR